jgi:hypothetical protein
MIQAFLERTLKGENKVINFKLPQELQAAVNFKIDNLPCSTCTGLKNLTRQS